MVLRPDGSGSGRQIAAVNEPTHLWAYGGPPKYSAAQHPTLLTPTYKPAREPKNMALRPALKHDLFIGRTCGVLV